jgi:hypothetical protein
MKQHKYSIVFRDNVIDELALRTGKSRELLEELVQLHYDRIDDIITNHETPYIIAIPYLGKLRMNYLLTMSFRKNFCDKSVDKHVDFFKDLIKKGQATLKNFRKPIILTQYMVIFDEVIRAKCRNFYNTVRVIEERHNEWYNKKFKNT